MDLRRLRYFIAVAEEANIGRAANRLNMAQPPLTRQIQQLETEVGTSLFQRTRKGVRMTNAGQVLFEEARNILALATRAQERTKLAGLGQSGRLDVGLFGSNILAVPQLLQTFRMQFPDIEVVVHAMNKEKQLEALYDRRVTVGFNLLGLKLAGIANEKVRSEPLVVAINEADPLSKRSSVSLKQISERPMVIFASGPRPNLMDMIFALCLEDGFQPAISQEVVDSVTAVSLVAAGFGVSLVPATVSQMSLPGVAFRRLNRSPPVMVDFNCIHRRDDTSPILKAFLHTIRMMRNARTPLILPRSLLPKRNPVKNGAL
ncbi:LysR family transcriptional regulator [Bradyrhizobium sp. dw_78]|uniref:LysR family transcriptional regulator n=1 Tax=Bradyrhizobium sp. dw_78 TaxID=2719793 RepID=UPI001BD38443|nr:LysR family transcriptional regulator [Bradyrhizobium sp. dw_78]